MKINWKNLIKSIIVPVLLGGVVGLLTSPKNMFTEINQPSFTPPGILFPIVWTILYTLMGISYYIVNESSDNNREGALKIYAIQLGVNLLWSFLFFSFRLYFLAFLWIILLIFLVIIMIKKFYTISKVSAYIQIPYLLWLVYAAILNFYVYLLN